MPKLAVLVDERTLSVDVPEAMLTEAETFFARMDRDMDRGWQMGPEFIEQPDRVQRCQIAANRLLVSLSTANETMATLMAGYILARLPGVTAVRVDTGGEMLNTEFTYAPGASPAAGRPAAASAAAPSKREALAEAGKQVSAVYRAGRGWRFATLDAAGGQWLESPVMDNEQVATEARMQAVRRRYEELLGARLN
jgi:hypothetical protein